MRRRIITALLLALMLPVSVLGLEPPEMEAAAAILVEKTTGTILYEKNADERRIPASITKIMTAILAIEHSDPDDIVTVNETAVRGMLERGGSCYLIAGEEVPFGALVRYTMLISGNEGANALAEHVSGSLAEFVGLMNKKAQELGMTGTRYGNAHGLNVIDHYATARDIATLSMYAMENEYFRQVVGETSFVFPATNKHEEAVTMYTINFMIGGDLTRHYLYPGVTGVKTGWVGKASGQCFSGSMDYEGLEYFAVVLGCDYVTENDFSSFPEAAKLFDYAKGFSVKPLVDITVPLCTAPVLQGKTGEELPLVPREAVTALLPIDFDPGQVRAECTVREGIQAPVEQGQELGSAVLYYGDRECGTVALVAGAAMPRAGLIARTADALGPAGIGIIAAAVLALAAAILLLGARRRRKKKAE